MNSKDFIIFVEYGGLGDHLFFSHLPRIAKAAGYDRVFLSSKSPFRSQDTKKLIWDLNPFFDGIIDTPYTFKPRFASVPENTNLLDKMMTELSLDDGESFHEPDLFYKPNFRPDVAGLTILDPNFISFVGNVPPNALAAYLKQNNIHVDAQLPPREKTADALPGIPTVHTKDLFDYCDLIHSCKQFLCFTSGGATLAAALKKPVLAFYGPAQLEMFHHSPQHTYIQLLPDGATAIEKRVGSNLLTPALICNR